MSCNKNSPPAWEYDLSMGQGQVSFDFSQSQWDRFGTGSCLSQWDKHNLSQWDKHNLSQSACPIGTGCACPSGTGLVQVTPFQSQHLTKFRVIPYQKTKGVLIEFGNSLSKIGLKLVKN